VGAWSSWESKNEGNGKMTITEQTPAKVTYRLEFPDYGMQSTGRSNCSRRPAPPRVWPMSGSCMNPMNRWFGLFLDKFIGTDFEARPRESEKAR